MSASSPHHWNLHCPHTREPLEWASDADLTAINRAIAEQRAFTRFGTRVTVPLTAALVNASRTWTYPAPDLIPHLLPDQAISGPGLLEE